MAEIPGDTEFTADVPEQTIRVEPSNDRPRQADTTSEQDRETAGARVTASDLATRKSDAAILRSAGQRHINATWERTQQVIAISVSWTVLIICGFLVIYGTPELRLLAFTLLSNVFFLVVGTYFQRTNHTKTGGVGGDEVSTER